MKLVIAMIVGMPISFASAVTLDCRAALDNDHENQRALQEQIDALVDRTGAPMTVRVITYAPDIKRHWPRLL
jgi:hypothetical protein